MRSPDVLEREVTPEAGRCGRDGVVSVQVHFLVLERAPEPLDEDVVTPGAAPIPAVGVAACPTLGRRASLTPAPLGHHSHHFGLELGAEGAPPT